jgi:hypothetical protein
MSNDEHVRSSLRAQAGREKSRSVTVDGPGSGSAVGGEDDGKRMGMGRTNR